MNTTPTSTTEFLDLPDGRLAYDDTGDGALVLRHEFQPTGVYLDSATYGLPPKVALQGLSAVTAAYTRKARTGLAARRGAFEHESESAPGRSLAWGQALGRRRGRGPLRDVQSGLANAHGRNFKSDRLRDANSTPPRPLSDGSLEIQVIRRGQAVRRRRLTLAPSSHNRLAGNTNSRASACASCRISPMIPTRRRPGSSSGDRLTIPRVGVRT